MVGVESFLGKTEFVSTNIFSYSLSFSVLAALPVLSSADADWRAGITKPSRARTTNNYGSSKRCDDYHHYSNMTFLNV